MATEASITFIGHATILLELDGTRLLTDPLLTTFVGPLYRIPPLPGPRVLNVDAVLISHLHGDHFDLPSLKNVGHDTPIIVPKGTATYLKIRRFKHIIEIEQGNSVDIGGVRIMATPAVHGGRNFPWTPLVEPLGYVIEGSHEIYFAGDTDLFPEMSAIGKNLDLALLPVWGWGPNLGKGHMDPLRAAQSLIHLTPDTAVPIHWGTYCPVGLHLLRPRFLTEPPRDFFRHAAQLTPDVNVQILEPGQFLSLPQ